MPGIDQLLSRVVERKGFHVQGADSEALLAKKGEDILLAAWKTDAPVTVDDARIFLTACEQVRAASAILVATKGVDQPAKDALAGAKGVEIWPESRLVIEVGDAFVKDALEGPAAAPEQSALPPSQTQAPPPAQAPGPRKFPSLVAQAATAATGGNGHGIAYYMPNKKKEQPADMQATIAQGRGGSLGYAWGGPGGSTAAGAAHAGIATTLPSKPRIQTDQWGNVIPKGATVSTASPTASAAPASRTINAEEEAYEIITTPKKKDKPTLKDASPPSCTTLKLNVTKDEAIAKIGKGTVAKLALVPHVAFEYDVNMSRPGMTEPITGKGAILVNSLSGDLRQVEALAYEAAEPKDARKEQEKLTAVDLYDKVKGFMAKTFSRTMNVEKEVAGNTVMSTLKLTPDPEEMGLEHKGIVHVPVWEVTIATGVAKVDAFTGNVLA